MHYLQPGTVPWDAVMFAYDRRQHALALMEAKDSPASKERLLSLAYSWLTLAALARISHATECFCEVRWDFPMLRRAGMQDCGAECAARGLMFFGSPWAGG
jgi:hypothetical protein